MGWRWRLVSIALSFVGLGTASPAIMAAVYPDKPIRFIVPFPPGGGLDIVARLVGDALSSDLGWKVLIDNRGGVGGAIVGTEAGAKAAPDGYTLTYGTNATHGIFGALYRGLPYDPVKDFVPVTKVAQVVNVLVVTPSLPVQSLGELIALAKSKPGALNYAAAGGLGSQGHLAMELMKGMAGMQKENRSGLFEVFRRLRRFRAASGQAEILHAGILRVESPDLQCRFRHTTGFRPGATQPQGARPAAGEPRTSRCATRCRGLRGR